MKKILLLIAFFVAFGQIVLADSVFTSYLNGTENQIFYTNETIYLAPSTAPVLSGSGTVRVYIVPDSNSWANQTVLTDVTGKGYHNITTNSSGYIDWGNGLIGNATAIWTPQLSVGNYDVVIDVNNNGVFDLGTDVVFDASTTGFQVLQLPAPEMTIAVGENNTIDQTYNTSSNYTDVVMLQLKMTAGIYEGVDLKSVSLLESGTGDASRGLSLVKLVADSNSDGIVDPGETIVAYGQYTSKDGVVDLPVTSPATGYYIPANTSAYFLVVYSMTNKSSNGDTYQFQVASATANGDISRKTAVIDLPQINSVLLTIAAANVTTTTTSTTTTTTTEVPTSTNTSTTNPSIQSQPTFIWFYVAGIISAVFAVAVIILFLKSRKPNQNQFTPQQ